MEIKVIALAVTALAAGINTASAVDGTINFTGTVSASTCTVNSIAGADSTTGYVDFGQVSNTSLALAGDTSIGTPFSIELVDCALTTTPSIKFEGTQVGAIGYTQLFESGAGEGGVGIRITDASTTSVYSPGISGINSGFGASIAEGGAATGNFNAFLVAYDDSTKSGDVDASVTFTIDYSGA